MLIFLLFSYKVTRNYSDAVGTDLQIQYCISDRVNSLKLIPTFTPTLLQDVNVYITSLTSKCAKSALHILLGNALGLFLQVLLSGHCRFAEYMEVREVISDLE